MTFRLPDAALEQDIAIVGRKGSGKTYAAKGIVEQLLTAQRRVCIWDPTGVWYGLRVGADGNAPGFPVVIFGARREDVAVDIEINDRDGEQLAETLAAANVPAVIDLSEFTMGERHRLATDFFRTLHARNRATLHLVIDEADEIAPQNPLPESRRMLHEIDRIVRRGRVKGFRVMLITQRPAVLHKNVLTQASTLIAMRLPAPQDRAAVEAWVKSQADEKQATKMMASLAGMPRGEGWVWSPEIGLFERARFPVIQTFDSSRAPEHDEAVQVVELGAIDLAAIRERFGRREEPQVAEAVSDHAAIEAARAEGYQRGLRDGRNQGRFEAFSQAATSLHRLEDDIVNRLKSVTKEWSDDTIARAEVERQVQAAAPPLPSPTPRQTAPAAAMLPMAAKILDAIHGAYPVALTFPAAAARAGASRRSSQYRDYERQVRASDQIEVVDGRFRSRTAQRVAPTGDPIEAWAGRLPPSYGAMLRQIAMARRALTKEEIATRASVSPMSSGLAAGLRELADLALIERLGDGRYQLAEGLR